MARDDNKASNFRMEGFSMLSFPDGLGAITPASNPTFSFWLNPEHFEYLSILSSGHFEGTEKSYPSQFELPASMDSVVYQLSGICTSQ
jgi:hypothetical protein